MRKLYGLIGYPLSHSFSPQYFNDKFAIQDIDAHYGLYPLERIEQWCDLNLHTFSGINVTIPYKKAILPYLDEIDPTAKNIGSVNTIKFKDGKSVGYNTDAWGFEKSLLEFVPDITKVDSALILGSGGAAAAVIHVLQSHNIDFQIVSRSKNKGVITYDDICTSFFEKNGLIINTTPLGMYPRIEECPLLPYELMNSQTFLYDLVYNPEVTTFLKRGQQQGCPTKNGYDMLIYQAEKAWEIWNEE